jgi:transitional endoplasmic reticulum ATPase
VDFQPETTTTTGPTTTTTPPTTTTATTTNPLDLHLGLWLQGKTAPNILLTGPPGTGKTYSVVQFAQQHHCALLAIDKQTSVTELKETFARAYQLTAASQGKKCIIFMDEIDSQFHKERNNNGLVAELLVLMDGVLSSSSSSGSNQQQQRSVVVIAATNYVNRIDSALRRPGRFDYEVVFKVPTLRERTLVLSQLTKDMKVIDSLELTAIAAQCVGFVGSDLAHLCTKAAENCIQRKGTVVLQTDFELAAKSLSAASRRGKEGKLNITTQPVIVGFQHVQKQLREAIEWPILYGARMRKIGLQPSKGVILHGLPGNGKTHMVRSLAYEFKSQVAFFSHSCAEIYSCYLGEAERRVRQAFTIARANLPCILFLDELDALVGKRGHGNDSSSDGQSMEARVLSTLLNEMDGIGQNNGSSSSSSSSNSEQQQPHLQLLVVAATNRIDMLDAALLRPGRFDKIVHVPLPTFDDRVQLFTHHLTAKTTTKPTTTTTTAAAAAATTTTSFEEGLTVELLAELTEGRSSSEIVNLCREASVACLHRDNNNNNNNNTSTADMSSVLRYTKAHFGL